MKNNIVSIAHSKRAEHRYLILTHNDEPCLVRPDEVVVVRAQQDGRTQVVVEGGTYFSVDEPVAEVLAALESLGHDVPNGVRAAAGAKR